MQRINWIDWVKAWCMMVVVFDHTPHDGSPFILQFLAGTNLASFFFISGYLKKPSTSQKESLKKYFYCLIIPYLIYNAIFYPYWLGKTYIEQGGILSSSDYLKPIIGALLGQLDSSFSCQLNGVTWFLISLFIMHWITDICNRQRNGKAWMLGISIIAMLLYGANKYFHFAPYLPFHGLVRCICFFFMGNLLRNANYLKEVCIRKDLCICFSMLALSMLLFYWHIHESIFIMHILLYFIVNALSVFGIIHLFRTLDQIRISLITCISIGTMVIFGLHRMLIGIIDYGMEKALHINDISYEWYEAILITVSICILLCPIIIYAHKYAPILIGKKSNHIIK
jgi:hypothetical protein